MRFWAFLTPNHSGARRKVPKLAQRRYTLNPKKTNPLGYQLSATGGRTGIPAASSSRFTSPTVVSLKWKIEAASAAWQ